MYVKILKKSHKNIKTIKIKKNINTLIFFRNYGNHGEHGTVRKNAAFYHTAGPDESRFRGIHIKYH